MLQTSRRKKIHIGPEDHGRRMSLDDFDHAIGREGYLYELGKGVIEVSEVPKLSHGKQVQAIRIQLALYQENHPGVLDYVASGNEAKLLIGPTESERHPDVLVYCTPAPDVDHPWSLWVPEIVVEVVSESSRKRDYDVKADEYLTLGIDEYWIIDGPKKQLTVLQRWRGGRWQRTMVKPPKKYATRLLPGFSLDVKRVLAAGAAKSKNGK